MPKCWVFSYPVVKITDTQVQTLYLTRGSDDQKSKGSDAVGSQQLTETQEIWSKLP